MPIIKGDRVAESAKLNRCSKRAHEAYAFYRATLTDDFCRFRYSPRLALAELYPRRTDVREREVRMILEEYRREGLLRVWSVDGVEFAEWTAAEPLGRRFHHTPEPPWSTHEHSTRCEQSGRAMERKWGATADGPSAEGGSEQRLLSPSSLPHTSPYNPPLSPPAAAGGGPASRSPSLEAQVEVLVSHWIGLGGRPTRKERRQLRERLKAGYPLEELRAEIEARMTAQRSQQAGAAALANAATWIEAHGGEEIVARGLMEWLQRERRLGESERDAIDRWCTGVPPMVFGLTARPPPRLPPRARAGERPPPAAIESG